MTKEKKCDKCNGTGKIEIKVCDECGSDICVGEYENKQICQDCWFKILSDDEIKDL